MSRMVVVTLPEDQVNQLEFLAKEESNRIGKEVQKDSEMTFYGSSFICDETGEIVAEADRKTEGVLTAVFDLDKIAQTRREWGVFRDRSPQMYQTLLTHGTC